MMSTVVSGRTRRASASLGPVGIAEREPLDAGDRAVCGIGFGKTQDGAVLAVMEVVADVADVEAVAAGAGPGCDVLPVGLRAGVGKLNLSPQRAVEAECVEGGGALGIVVRPEDVGVLAREGDAAGLLQGGREGGDADGVGAEGDAGGLAGAGGDQQCQGEAGDSAGHSRKRTVSPLACNGAVDE
jgi:hypothetical protein